VIDTAGGFARPSLQVAAVVVMLLAFGSVVAMGLPILTALLGVGIGYGILAALSHLIIVPTFGPDIMIMIGVGIDYALFVVTRYRQALAEPQSPRDATIAALSTAGRALRGGHDGHRPARAVRGGPAVHGRPRGCDDRGGRSGAGGRAHPSAGDLRLGRDGHRPAAHPWPVRQARRHQQPGVLDPMERNGTEAAMDLRAVPAEHP
jgi:hypothetical protein